MNTSPAPELLRLKNLSYQSLLELATADGINASGKDEIYGCIFGRDSAITILKILKSIENERGSLRGETTNNINHSLLLDICRRSLLKLCELQGRETNINSGEEPGKFIHEFRPDNYKHLQELPKPWYVYPDGILRNYDSIDATPLALIALYRYWKLTQDAEFLLSVLPAVEKGLNWIISYGDRDHDYLIEYELHPNRILSEERQITFPASSFEWSCMTHA